MSYIPRTLLYLTEVNQIIPETFSCCRISCEKIMSGTRRSGFLHLFSGMVKAQAPLAGPAFVQPGALGPPAQQSSSLYMCACSFHTQLPGYMFRAMEEQVLNRSGARRGERAWKIRCRECTSPVISWKGPLATCLKHVGLQRTKWLFQNTWVLLHIEAEAEIKSKARQIAYRRGSPLVSHVCPSFPPLLWVVYYEKFLYWKVGQALKQVPQGNGGITILGNIQKLYIGRS